MHARVCEALIQRASLGLWALVLSVARERGSVFHSQKATRAARLQSRQQGRKSLCEKSGRESEEDAGSRMLKRTC